MNQTAAYADKRVVVLACLGLAMSAILPLNGALPADATAVPTSIAAVSSVALITAADPPSAAHPYSDPMWSPLRTASRVGCVRTNCPGPYHGYWAIDFIGNLGDPLYAAGAGVFHVGAVDNTCRTVAKSGTWVWIDHGAGRTTRYTHLNTVLLKEGQLVTPSTQIGTVGHSGYKCGPPNYLHMEYHVRGKTGPMVAPGVMLACVRNGPRISMPTQGLFKGTYSGLRAATSYAAWDLVPTNTNPNNINVWTSNTTNDCLATSRGAATPSRPVATGRRGSGSATISWGVVPAGVGHTVVTIDMWHPSLGRYGNPVYRVVKGRTSSTRFTGLLNGRGYRLRATTHNGAGYSAWSPYVKVTPAAVPAAPRAPRALSTTTSRIQYAWWLPANNGTAISGFQVARRCVVSGSWTGWAYTSLVGSVNGAWNLHYNWTSMPRGRTCQVTVRARNSVGYGKWSVRSRATTLR